MQTCLKYYFDTPDQLWSSIQGIFIYPPYVQKGVTFFQGAGSCVERGGTPAIVLWDVMNLSRLAASMPLAMTNMGNALAMALARPGTTWKLVNLAVNQLVSPVQQTWHQNLWTSLNNLFPTFLSEVPASFFLVLKAYCSFTRVFNKTFHLHKSTSKLVVWIRYGRFERQLKNLPKVLRLKSSSSFLLRKTETFFGRCRKVFTLLKAFFQAPEDPQTLRGIRILLG